MASADGSLISSWYRGKNIFITGGTGFVGIGLINKLLYSCPDVGTIYVLMRPKRGKEVSERLQELTKNEVFETLLTSQSTDIFSKLHAIAGDVGAPGLGISPEDRQLLVDNVNVVFHSAASLDFAQSLRTTVEINLLGTRCIAELCKEMKHLEALVHVSSAYANSFLLDAKEQLYPLEVDPETVIEAINKKSDAEIVEELPELLKGHPNTYTFTKHMAEHEINKIADRIPSAIVRPSMIQTAWKEPVPGWTMSKNGPQGFVMGAAKGVVRRLPVLTNIVYDYIPVDVVINQLIVAAFHVGSKKLKTLSIYHCTSSTYRPFRWDMITHRVNEYLHEYPIKSAVWYPHLKFVDSLTTFKVAAFFVHMIPAILLDMLLRVTGGRPILVRLHTNVNESLNLLEKFIFSEWKYHNTHTLELCRTLNDVDAEKFYIDIRNLNWEAYFIDLMLGVRRYLNKENVKTMAKAKSKDKLLFVFHMLFQALVFLLIWYLFALIVGASMTNTVWILPIVYFLYVQL